MPRGREEPLSKKFLVQKEFPKGACHSPNTIEAIVREMRTILTNPEVVTVSQGSTGNESSSWSLSGLKQISLIHPK